MIHYANCIGRYPEKPEDEPSQLIEWQWLESGYWVATCVDCGAFETNLPPEEDPYWDEIRNIK
jgi:hypothetical protein